MILTGKVASATLGYEHASPIAYESSSLPCEADGTHIPTKSHESP